MRIYQQSVQTLLEGGLQTLLASGPDFRSIKKILTDREPIKAMIDYAHQALLADEQMDQADSRAEQCRHYYQQQLAKDASDEQRDEREAQADLQTAKALPDEMSRLREAISDNQLQLETQRQRLAQARCQLECLKQQRSHQKYQQQASQRELSSVQEELRNMQQVVIDQDSQSDIPGVVVKSPRIQQLEAKKMQLESTLTQMRAVIKDFNYQIRQQEDLERSANLSYRRLEQQIENSERRLKEHDIMLRITLPQRESKRQQRSQQRALRAMSRQNLSLENTPSQVQIEATLAPSTTRQLRAAIEAADKDLRRKRLQLEESVKKSSYQYFFDAFETFQSQLKMSSREREALYGIYQTMQDYLAASSTLAETKEQILTLNQLIRGCQQENERKEHSLQRLNEERPQLEQTIEQLQSDAASMYQVSRQEGKRMKINLSLTVSISVIIAIIVLANPPALTGLSIGFGSVGALLLLITVGYAMASFIHKQSAVSKERQQSETKAQLEQATERAKVLQERAIPALNQQLNELARERQQAEASKEQQQAKCTRILAKAKSIAPSSLIPLSATSPVAHLEVVEPSAPPAYPEDELPSYQSAMAM